MFYFIIFIKKDSLHPKYKNIKAIRGSFWGAFVEIKGILVEAEKCQNAKKAAKNANALYKKFLPGHDLPNPKLRATLPKDLKVVTFKLIFLCQFLVFSFIVLISFDFTRNTLGEFK